MVDIRQGVSQGDRTVANRCKDGEPCSQTCISASFVCREDGMTGSVAQAANFLLQRYGSGSAGLTPATIAGASSAEDEVTKALQTVTPADGKIASKRPVNRDVYQAYATGDQFQADLSEYLADPSNASARAKIQSHVDQAYAVARKPGESDQEYAQRALAPQYQQVRASMDISLAETLPRNANESDADYASRKEKELFAASGRMLNNARIDPETGLRRVIDDAAIEDLFKKLDPKVRKAMLVAGAVGRKSNDWYNPSDPAGNTGYNNERSKYLLKMYLETGARDVYTGQHLPYNKMDIEHINNYTAWGKRAEQPDNLSFTSEIINKAKGEFEKDSSPDKANAYTAFMRNKILTPENRNRTADEWDAIDNQTNKATAKSAKSSKDASDLENFVGQWNGSPAELFSLLADDWTNGGHSLVPKDKRYYALKPVMKTSDNARNLRGAEGRRITKVEEQLGFDTARAYANDPTKFNQFTDKWNANMNAYSQSLNDKLAELAADTTMSQRDKQNTFNATKKSAKAQREKTIRDLWAETSS